MNNSFISSHFLRISILKQAQQFFSEILFSFFCINSTPQCYCLKLEPLLFLISKTHYITYILVDAWVNIWLLLPISILVLLYYGISLSWTQSTPELYRMACVVDSSIALILGLLISVVSGKMAPTFKSLPDCLPSSSNKCIKKIPFSPQRNSFKTQCMDLIIMNKWTKIGTAY